MNTLNTYEATHIHNPNANLYTQALNRYKLSRNERITTMNELISDNNCVQNATPSTPAKITLEQCQAMSDTELLEMISKSTGHTKDFQSYMNCNFTYNCLCDLLKNIGYAYGWHKKIHSASDNIDTIIIKTPAEKPKRQTFEIEKSVADEWRAFNNNIPHSCITLRHALKRFMADYRSGKIKFELQI